MLADQFTPGFAMELMHKDIRLALQLAESQQLPLPVATAACRLYAEAIRQGRGGESFSAVAKVCQGAAPQS